MGMLRVDTGQALIHQVKRRAQLRHLGRVMTALLHLGLLLALLRRRLCLWHMRLCLWLTRPLTFLPFPSTLAISARTSVGNPDFCTHHCSFNPVRPSCYAPSSAPCQCQPCRRCCRIVRLPAMPAARSSPDYSLPTSHPVCPPRPFQPHEGVGADL